VSKLKKLKSYSAKNRLGAIVIVAFLAIGGSAYLLFAKAATTSVSIPLTSSAVISSKSATLVSANPAILQTTGLGNNIGGYRSFLKFNVTTPNTTDTINSVQLKVYTQTANSAGFYLKGVADSTWDPTKITYNTHPVIGSILADSGATTVNSWKTIDLTKYVTAKGLVSFCLYPKDGGIIQYSNAGTTAPQLVVTYTSASAPVDTLAPTNVGITAPTSGSNVKGVYNFTSSASDNVGVTKVEFYNDSALIGTALTSTASGYVIPGATAGTTGYDTTKIADGTHNIYSIAYDAAGNKTQSATVSYTIQNIAPPPPPPSTIVRATFYYPWFPETWGNVTTPDTQYHPTAGFYSSDTASVITKHIQEMTYAGLDASIASWWGQGQHKENTRIPALLNNSANSSNGKNLKWSLYYEQEAYGDPTVAQITSDLTYIKNNYASNANYLQINGKPVIFVYDSGTDTCATAQRWHDANTVGFYVVLKVFSGYATCATQPDGWHQYGPASATDSQGKYSYSISPGFFKYNETTARLPRLSAAAWTNSVNAMVASNAQFQLVTTFNEWGEGTAVEPANEWASASGYGTYIDILHSILNANAPIVLDTTAPTAPTGFKAALASTTSKTVNLSWTASTDSGTGVKQYDITRTDSANNKATFTVTAPATTYSDTSTIYNTSYTYSIIASDNASPSNVSTPPATASATTPAQPVTAPAAPTGLTATSVSSTQINLSWTASVDTTGLVGGYRVFRNSTQIADIPGTGTSYADTGLTASTTYSYTVLAYDSVTSTLVSPQSSSVSTATQAAPQTPSDTTPPTNPTNVTAVLASPTTNTVNISWGASTDSGTGLKQYIVSRTDSASNVVQFTVPAGTTTYSDSSTNYSTSTTSSSYVYAVSAQDNAVPANTSAAVSAASVTTPIKPDTAAPNVPGAPTVSIVSIGQTTISWSAVTDNPTDGTASGVKGYKVFRDGVQIADVATLSVNDSFAFVAGQAYKYTVLAYDVAGNASAQSSATSSTPSPIIATSSYCGNAPTGNKIDTVIVIAMENHAWSSVGGVGFASGVMPYTKTIADSCYYFKTDMETEPNPQNSATQYVGSWTGCGYSPITAPCTASTNVNQDCSPSATACNTTQDNIFRVLRNANIPHREYVEGATNACSPSGNAVRHIPEMYMYDPTDKAQCANEVLPLLNTPVLTTAQPNCVAPVKTQFDWSNPPTGYSFITPTLFNDMHTGTVAQADCWLNSTLPALFNSAQYKSGKVLIQYWTDEEGPKPNLFACWSCKHVVGGDATSINYATESRLWLTALGSSTYPSPSPIQNAIDIKGLVGAP
jgi:Glycosyl hydrolase family 99/Fibronectin type III domain